MAALLVWGVAGALFLVGLGAVVAPNLSASQYGLAPDGPVALSFVQAMGARDMVLGLMILAAPDRPLQRTLIALIALVALADLLIVLGRRGKSGAKNAAIHGVGMVGLGVVWLLLGSVS